MEDAADNAENEHTETEIMSLHRCIRTLLKSASRATRLAGLLVAASCLFAVDAAAQTLPVLSIDSPSVNEGDSGSTNLDFTVTLSAASTSQVTVAYADAGTGTATSGTDYTALTAGTLTIAAGDTTGTITVSVTGDTTHESHETVEVTLSNPTNATISTTAGTGTGTIRDDENPTLSVDSPTVTEGDSGSTNMTFTVSLSPASSQRVRVVFGITGGTATCGTDYTTTLNCSRPRINMTFNPGQTSRTVTLAVQGDTVAEAHETVLVALSGVSFGARIGTGTGTGTITDDDQPNLSINSPSVTEGDSGSTDMTFTVSLSAASTVQVTVDYANVGGGTATSGTDYAALSQGTLTFAPGETSQTITVSVTGDTDPEADETVRVALSQITVTNAVVPGSSRIGVGTIIDDDQARLRTGPASVTEGDSGSVSLTFTVTLVAVSGAQVTVDYADAGTGTATSGTDYTAVTAGTLTIAAGDASGTITVSVTGDTEAETPETVVLTLSNPTNARFLTQSMATLTGTITDDDNFPVSNAGPDQTVNEGDTVNLSGSGSDPDGTPVTYQWHQTEGPVVTLTGATTTTPSFTAPTGLTADTVLRFSLVVTSNFEGTSDSVDITVDAANPSWTASAGTDQTVDEEDTVNLSGTGPTLQGVGQPGFSWSHTAGGRYTVSLTGATTATPSFTAPNLLADDTLTFTLTVTVGDDTVTDTVDVTVRADNDPPTAEAGPPRFGYRNDTITFAGSGSDPEDETVTYSWSQTGGDPTVTLTGATTTTPSFTAPILEVDTSLTFTLTVTAGGATATDTVEALIFSGPAFSPSLVVADAGLDQTVDGGDAVSLDGTFSGGPPGRDLSYSWSQTGGGPRVTLSGETTATPSFTAPDVSSDVTLTFSLTVTVDAVTDTATVDVTVRASVPVSTPEEDPEDPINPPPGVLRAYAGADQTVFEGELVQLSASGSDLDGETIYSWAQTGGSPRVSLTGPDTSAPSFTAPNVTEDTTLTFTLTVIADGESATDTVDVTVVAYPMLSVDSPSVAEGDSGSTALTFTVSLSAASSRRVTASYATADGTANAGTDYRAASGELRFAPGETELTVSVMVLGDTRPERDETLTLTLSGPVNAEIADDALATGVIVNDDTAQVSVADTRVEEGDSGMVDVDFRVSLSVAGDLEVTVTYATADGTASAESDYQAASGELRFAPGETELTVSVPVLGDTRPERDETFTLTLSSPVNAALAGAEATATIVNDDTALASVADARVEEGDSGMADVDFRVTLSAAGDLEVTMAYATADGTASAGADYQATSGELRFAPGETEHTVSVPVLGDMRPERDETFTLTLSSPVNAELARAQAMGVIVNDDTASASIADMRMEEGDSGMTDIDFSVTLSVAGDLEVTVAYETADGTANAGSDYQTTSGELRFAPGETELAISVPVLGDTAPEMDETFTVTLSSPSNAQLATTAATGTIVDDDVAGARTKALEASMAGFGRALTWDAVDAISGRFNGGSAARASRMVLGGSPVGQQGNAIADQFAPWNHDLAPLQPHDPWRNQLSLRDFLQRSSFHLALSGDGEGEDEGLNLSVWGQASSGRFSGQPATGMSSQGDVVTGYLGMDAKVDERLFAGVALAHSNGTVDYGISNFAGDLDMSLTSLLPYANFQLNEKLAIWSMVGIGWGEATFQDAVRSGRAESRARGTLDLGLRMAAVGANRALATWRNVDLELKSDAFVMSMTGEPNGSETSEINARSQGIRLTLAGRKELMATERGRLGANLEFGGRWDGGDAQTGAGTELGGGLDYRHADLGLGVSVQGQYLLFHQAQSFEDKGVSVTLEFDPGIQGRGFSLALRPAWGAYSGGAQDLWNDEALLRIGGTARNAALGTASERLDLEWGYGLGLRGDTGLLRLQGALSHQGIGQRRYRLGGFLTLSERTRSSLELNRQEWLGEPRHGFLIRWEYMR